MIANRILDGLETLDLQGEDAAVAARMGFLEWVFATPGAAIAKHAAEALEAPEAQNPGSDAAEAFVGYLRAATCTVTTTRMRGGRARRLH